MDRCSVAQYMDFLLTKYNSQRANPTRQGPPSMCVLGKYEEEG